MKDKNNINDLINTKANEEKIENNISPKVSIIVPIYNVEKYLRQCLDSIVNQTLKDIEIILVDDGSTDSCPSICDEYASKDKRIIVIHKENAGLGAAYNTGLDIAKGDYIGFVESDDFIELNMYEELYNKAVESGVEVVIGGFYFVNNGVKKPETSILNSVNEETIKFLKYHSILTHGGEFNEINEYMLTLEDNLDTIYSHIVPCRDLEYEKVRLENDPAMMMRLLSRQNLVDKYGLTRVRLYNLLDALDCIEDITTNNPEEEESVEQDKKFIEKNNLTYDDIEYMISYVEKKERK